MGKKILRFIILLMGLIFLCYGGYIVYQKQYFPISHQSFANSEGVQVFVPNAKALYEKKNGLNILESYAGDDWLDLVKLILGQVEEPFSLQINNDSIKKSVSFNGLSKAFLELNYAELYAAQKGTITIVGKPYHYWRNNDYLVFSNTEINPKTKKKEAGLFVGNADFFFQSDDSIIEGVKLTENVKFSAYIMRDSLLKGKPVNPIPLLSICPTSAQIVNFYGSTRFIDDAKPLLSTVQSDQLIWIKSELLYIQKDSFEILAGIQNDGIRLKNLILEAMQEGNETSVQKPSMYFNNTEIIPFDLNWDWSAIYGDLKSEMKYFAAYNDIVFLSNSLQSMYWLLKNIQLGKTYDAFEISKKVPSRVNLLSLYKSELGTAISSKTWVSTNRSINLAAMSNRIIRSNSEQLVADFTHVEPCKYLLYSAGNSGSQIVSVNGNVLQSYQVDGTKDWSFKCKNKVNVLPKVIDLLDQKSAVYVVANGNNLTVINDKGKIYQDFNKQFAGDIKEVQVIKTNVKTLIVVKTAYQVSFFNLKGKESIQPVTSLSKILSASVQAIDGAKILAVINAEDSAMVYDLSTGLKAITTKLKHGSGARKSIITGEKRSASQLKLLSYEGGYLKIQYFSNSGMDSIKLNTKMIPDKVFWIKFKGKWVLAFETYDQLIIFNDLGLKEIEISKPEPNCIFVAEQFIDSEIFAFKNPANNKWYFTDEYGDLLIRNPIDNEGLTFVYGKVMVSKSQNRIHIYNID